MSCARYVDAIADHACGAEIAPDAARHLAACDACSARFAERRRLVEGLDSQLERALAVVPSATFVRRVRSRIEQSPGPSARLLWWRACGAAAAILLVIGIGVWRSSDGVRPRTNSAPPEASAESGVPAAPDVPPVVEGPQGVQPVERPVVRHVPRGPALERRPASMPAAEVLVSPDQQRAIAHLMRLVRDGTLDASSLPVSRQDESTAPAALVVPPLTIEPIAVPDVEIPTGPAPAGRNSQ